MQFLAQGVIRREGDLFTVAGRPLRPGQLVQIRCDMLGIVDQALKAIVWLTNGELYFVPPSVPKFQMRFHIPVTVGMEIRIIAEPPA
jgi:hypothetical protein